MNKELLSVPDIVKGDACLLGMTNTSGVTSSDEMCDTAVDTRGSVPHDFSGASIVHWGWPNSEDGVLWVESSVVEEGLMLLHTLLEWDIIILAPATKWVEKEDRVSISLFDKLLTGILEKKYVTIVERVSNLESIDDVSILGLNSRLDLAWCQSVLVISIVKHGSLDEFHSLARDEEISLSEDSLGLWMILRHAAEGTSADFFLTVVENRGLVDDGKDLIRAESSTGKSNRLLTFKISLLLSSNILSDRNGEEVTSSFAISEGLHVHDFEKLHLVHESSERGSETISNSLKIFNLMLGDINLYSDKLYFLSPRRSHGERTTFRPSSRYCNSSSIE